MLSLFNIILFVFDHNVNVEVDVFKYDVSAESRTYNFQLYLVWTNSNKTNSVYSENKILDII